MSQNAEETGFNTGVFTGFFSIIMAIRRKPL